MSLLRDLLRQANFQAQKSFLKVTKHILVPKSFLPSCDDTSGQMKLNGTMDSS